MPWWENSFRACPRARPSLPRRCAWIEGRRPGPAGCRRPGPAPQGRTSSRSRGASGPVPHGFAFPRARNHPPSVLTRRLGDTLLKVHAFRKMGECAGLPAQVPDGLEREERRRPPPRDRRWCSPCRPVAGVATDGRFAPGRDLLSSAGVEQTPRSAASGFWRVFPGRDSPHRAGRLFPRPGRGR